MKSPQEARKREMSKQAMREETERLVKEALERKTLWSGPKPWHLVFQIKAARLMQLGAPCGFGGTTALWRRRFL